MPDRTNEGDQPRARARLINEFTETRVTTRRAVRARGDVVYGSDLERTRFPTDENPEIMTEVHGGAAEAACGCLITGELKPRFHRDGTMVCQNHYYFCPVCDIELLPLDIVIVEKRVYCRGCGETAIDQILWIERRTPGTFEKALIAHLTVVKWSLRSRRWSLAWSRIKNKLLRRGELQEG